MQVSAILKNQDRPIETIEATRSVLDAVRHLVDRGIGSLLVTAAGGGDVVGIITERDVLRISAERSGELEKVEVAEVMTRDLVSGGPDDKITDLLNVMTERRIRHLPIMDGKKLKGLVSIGDLVKAQFDHIENENRHLKDYIQGG